jgi:hypothetical protein
LELDRRPLYIAPGADTRVDLDGPALSVTREERAEQLFPLQRICRVYSGADAEWTSAALLACAQRGIAVLFVDEEGAIQARVLGRPGIDETVPERLMEFLAATYAGEQAELQVRQWLRAAAYSWMQEHLLALGLGAENELAQVGEPVLARDLTGVFIWYLEPARIGWLRRRALAARRKREPVRLPTHREVIRLFESHPARAAARGREITGALHRWLIREG